MFWLTNQRQRGLLLALLLPALAARAQTPAGDGLIGQYYDGENFERVMLIRYDPTVDFDWGHGEPGPGLPTEHFSVRWSGWLVAPVSGRYRFNITVDDGMRLWLNNHLILNEWRNQSVRQFTKAVVLKAGQRYRLQVDYYQNILDTKARVTWERPDVPGVRQPIPSRYLFSKPPKPAVAASPVAAAAVSKPAARPVSPSATGGPAPARPAPRRPVVSRSVPAVPKPVVAAPAVPVPTTVADSASTDRVTRLAAGETVTLPDLYFEQGKARLLPEARAALDGLAAALHARPTLRLEVQGHTDNVGNAELNRQLSQQRAEAVCLYLTAHGVAQEQLRPSGYGGTRPVADNGDPAQRPKNRRVVLVKL
jgi:outer membrane protein OmpA-like peptidoglycan-associated protein